MSDEMIEWYERQDVEALLEEFLTMHNLLVEWNAFLTNRWVCDEADAADALYDMHKDEVMTNENKN